MKIIKILSIAYLLVLFSCGEKEYVTDTYVELIKGKWELISVLSNDIEQINQSFDCYNKLTISNNTLKFDEYTTDNNFNCVFKETSGENKYTVLGNNLTVIIDNKETDYEIVELNDKIMKLQNYYVVDGGSIIDIETFRRL